MKAVVALAVGSIALAAGSSHAASGRIVFAANRLPQTFGEIYRVTAAGRHLDLSKSAAPDVGPAVSPNGRWVAFLSGRGGEWAFYVVGSDGRGLRRVSPPVARLEPNDTAWAQIAWAPDSRGLAAEFGGPSSFLYLGTRTGLLHRVGPAASTGWFTSSLGWSHDGRLLAYSTPELVRVVDRAGKRLWWAPGSVGAHPWSADGRLAVAADSETVAVYDSRGRTLARFPGTMPSWNTRGTLLASASRSAVGVRRGGAGAPILRWPARNAGSLQWIDSTKLRFQGPNGWIGVDVAHDRRWSGVHSGTPYNSVLSPAGRALAETFAPDNSSRLVLGTKTIATGPWCPDEGDFAGLAFMPHGLGVVYQTACAVPSADLYSVNPDGSGLHRITRTPVDEMEPSVSPDGASIVYAQQLVAGKCDGCAQTLWRVPVNGGTPVQLTRHSDQDKAPFDQDPTWSPDGSEIAFQNSGASAPIRLLEMPATGGAVRDLKAKGAALPQWGPNAIAYADWGVAHLSVKTVDPATGAIRTVATGGKTDAQALAWSNSGRLAYLYLDDRGHPFVAIAGSKAKPLDLGAVLAPQARVAGLAWSPDGTRFAFAATDVDGNGEIYTIGTDGTGLRQVTHDIGALYVVPYEGTISWR